MGPFRADTVSTVELLWSLAALVGLVFTLWALRDARADRRYLRASGLNGARRIVAEDAVRWEWIRAGMMALFLLVGVSAMTRVDPPRALTAGQVIYSALALYVPASSAYGTIMARRGRARLLAYLKRREAERAAGGC